ncbi:MATE family efflux transporter [Propionimicrobium sp. BV2F7]|uniref:MATE family efflux transporter n=1 Tax=Propionimicrobium sp. BV2F7 TaxID=1111131 RepID=UPI0003D79C3C|nr:MATE family efflux transporter [Propionimicrobium sp. BV2F7]ETJ98111.1 MATE efflux family protein [Propionimicrobium sp. BV2F7]
MNEARKPTAAKEILRLAVPTLGALLVQPVLLLADSAIVGHWSTDSLAGLGLAQTVLLTIVGLCVFLAYSTTAATARALGAGKLANGLKAGVDAIWLAIFIGIAVATLTASFGGWILGLFAAEPSVISEGTKYLAVSAIGLPAMLSVQAATGVIRGLQDTRTPLLVSLLAAVVNVPLSVVLVFTAGWGVVGAAVGTVVAQYLMAVILVSIVWKKAIQHQISLRPEMSGVASAWRGGVPILVRTLAMRIGMLMLSACAAKLGTTQLAAHQIVLNLWNLLANGLDAVAIAAQSITGKYLGAGDVKYVRSATRQMTRWGVFGGTGAAALVLACSWLLPKLFSPDVDVQGAISVTLLVVVICQPLAGYVYVLDGVLMGAGDTVYLAKVSAFNLLCFIPAIVLWIWLGLQANPGLVWLWIAYGGWYMALRAVTLWIRQRSNKWIRVGD